ncbi:MAG: hypothetical protein EKK37_18075, partial [Sphingobacteriales bacterium]
MPAGVTASWSSNTITITGTPSVAGSYNYSIPLTGGCGSVNATGTITVSVVPTTTGVTICAGGTGSLTSSFTCPGGGSGSAGPNNAGIGADNSAVGTVLWTNPGNIVNATGATASVSSNAITHYLQGSNYGFSIPSNATINGITVVINRQSSGSTSPFMQDNIVSLVKGGTIQSTNKANTGTDWPTASSGNATYGSNSDLWGTTWLPSDINSSTFGVVLSGVNANGSRTRTATVNSIQVTITYTINGTLNWYTVSSGGSSIGSGSPFNPVGVSGSGLPNTNTPGTYTFYAECSTAPGCRTATNFVINARPTSVISGSATICNGGSTQLSIALTGAQPWSLTYSDGTTPVTVNNISSSPYTFNVSPSSTKTYTVTALSDANCTSQSGDRTGSATVTVNQLSIAPTGATGTTTICNGSSTILTVTGGTKGTGAITEWFTGSCGGTSAGTGDAITVSPTTTTTYYVRYNGTCNTTTCATVTVTVNQPSVAPTSITGTTTICNGGSTTLTAAGGTLGTGANYQWGTGSVVGTNPLTGQTSSTLTVSPTSTTTYWVRIENTASPCTGNTGGVTQTVTVNQPSVAPTGITGTTTICNGGSTTLTAAGGTLGTGANYQWGTGSVVGTNPLAGQTSSTLTVSPTSTTTYWVRIENTASPCTGNTGGVTQTVTVNALPNNTSANGFTGSTICIGGTGTLTFDAIGATFSTPYTIKYTDGTTIWSQSISSASPTTFNVAVNPTTTTTYTLVSITNGNGCTNTTSGISNKTATITVNPASVGGSISGSATVCATGNSGTLTLSGQTGSVVKWQSSTDNFVSNIVDITNTTTSLSYTNLTQTTSYRAVVQSGVCTSVNSSTATITVNQAPSFTACPSNIIVNTATGLCTTLVTYTATATGTPAPTITYSFSGATTGSGSGTGSGSTFNKGVTTVTITAANSCSPAAICSFTVTVNDNQAPVIGTCAFTRNITGCNTSAITGPVFSSTEAASSYAVFSDATNQGTATDNCAITTVTYIDVASGSCPIVVTRTWKISDAAGNNVTCQQIINIIDNIAPVLSGVPADVTVECDAVPTAATPTATDNCDAAPVITYSEVR